MSDNKTTIAVTATCDICGEPLPMTEVNGEPTGVGYEAAPLLYPGSVCCEECHDAYVTRARAALDNNDSADMMDLSHDIIGNNPIPRRIKDRHGRAAAYTRARGFALAMADDVDWVGSIKEMHDRLEDMLDALEEMCATCEDIAYVAEARDDGRNDDAFYYLGRIAETVSNDLYSVKVKTEDDIAPGALELLDAFKRLPMAE